MPKSATMLLPLLLLFAICWWPSSLPSESAPDQFVSLGNPRQDMGKWEEEPEEQEEMEATDRPTTGTPDLRRRALPFLPVHNKLDTS